MMFTLNKAVILEKIFEGPSQDVFQCGISLQGEGELAYYDDNISFEDEIVLFGYLRTSIRRLT